MNRRFFLKLLGLGAAGAAVAAVLPQVVEAKPAPYKLADAKVIYTEPIAWDGTYGTLQRDMFPTLQSYNYRNVGFSLKDFEKDFEATRVDCSFRYTELDRRRIGRAIRKARRLAPLTQAK